LAHCAEGGVASKPTMSVPKLVIKDTSFDFGTVNSGEIVSHVFEVSNEGKVPLLITSHQAVCGCTSSVLDDSEVLPGETSRIQATFDTAGFSGAESKVIRVETNDPYSPSFALTLKGLVLRQISVLPERVAFGKVRRGTSPVKEVVITVDKSVAQIKEIDVLSEQIVIADRKDSNGSISFLVRLKDDTPVGTFRNDVIIKTSSEEFPILTLPVFAVVESDFEVFPSEVSFGLLDAPLSQDLEKKVTIKNTSTKIKILEIESSNDSIKVESLDADSEHERLLLIKLKSGSIGTIKDKVIVRVEHQDPLQQEIVIPVYAIVTKDKD